MENLRIPHKSSLVSDYVTISVGMNYQENNNDATVCDLYKKADDALYSAKMAGRNQMKIF